MVRALIKKGLDCQIWNTEQYQKNIKSKCFSYTGILCCIVLFINGRPVIGVVIKVPPLYFFFLGRILCIYIWVVFNFSYIEPPSTKIPFRKTLMYCCSLIYVLLLLVYCLLEFIYIHWNIRWNTCWKLFIYVEIFIVNCLYTLKYTEILAGNYLYANQLWNLTKLYNI